MYNIQLMRYQNSYCTQQYLEFQGSEVSKLTLSLFFENT